MAFAAIAVQSPTMLSAATIINLGTLGNPVPTSSRAYAISDDGFSVTGYSQTQIPGPNNHAFRWTAGSGMVDLGTLGALNSFGTAVSGDGAAIAGYTDSGRAFRWTTAGMQDLGSIGLGSRAYGISNDGNVIAGWSTTPGSVQHAFRWTSAGMQDLGVPVGNNWSRAFGISGDGSTVVGDSSDGLFEHAFRWTAGSGWQDLGTLGGVGSIATAVNEDGSVIAGDSNVDASGNTHAFRWGPGGLLDLGTLGGVSSSAMAMSNDATSIVGASGTITGSTHAFLWKSELGMVDLNTYLPTLGVNLSGWTLGEARGISSDGSSLTGWGTFNGQFRGWLVTGVPEPSSLSLLLVGVLLTRNRRRARGASVPAA